MLRRTTRFAVATPTAMVLACAIGCGGGASAIVTGAVTYDGQPVQRGWINFIPANGDGPSAGAAIEDGQYRADLTPGTKIVRVVSSAEGSSALRSPEDLARASREAQQRKTGQQPTAPKPLEAIPADAVGNNATVEVKPGDQTLDFSLQKPTATTSL